MEEDEEDHHAELEMELWPHQRYGIDETLDAIERGERRILITSPTGGGKTTIMRELAASYLSSGRKVVVYSNRRMLVEQTSRVFGRNGFDHGIRMGGSDEGRHEDLQLASLQTESRRGTWQLHDAELVIVDEAHLHAAETARKILGAHHDRGAAYVGFTATPLGLAGLYDTLIQAGTTSELRACGAMVPCYHYGPDEPDLKGIGKLSLGQDLTEKEAVKAIMRHGIFGRVLESYERLNPDHRPAILFAPGVKESVWFAEQFVAAGISAAHIDGEEVWVNGNVQRSDKHIRSEVLEDSRTGRISVLCNRYVLREGIDAPWLGHGIFATVFGSLQSYLQSGGRLLRAHSSLDHVTLQDHGGNWHRHGSLNADRLWDLQYTSAVVAGLREKKLREKREREPMRCPQCAAILVKLTCRCGYVVEPATVRSRPVVQSDGTLKEMRGDIFKPRRVYQKANGPELWEKMYWRARTKKWDATFRQAVAMFASENYWAWPDPSWPCMPRNEFDWFKKVKDVPFELLTAPPTFSQQRQGV